MYWMFCINLEKKAIALLLKNKSKTSFALKFDFVASGWPNKRNPLKYLCYIWNHHREPRAESQKKNHQS